MRSPGYQLVLVDCDLIHVISAGFVLHETEDKVDAAPYLQDCDEVIIVKKDCKDKSGTLSILLLWCTLTSIHTKEKEKSTHI